VSVANRVWGPLFGYRGSFDVAWKLVRPEDVPDDVKPQREQRRE
jgi:hypothetical protein